MGVPPGTYTATSNRISLVISEDGVTVELVFER
jgi:hypothetical protein